MSRRLKRGFVATTDSKKGEPIKNVKREREIERQNQGECLTAVVALLLPWRDCNCFGIIFKKVGNKHTLFFHSLSLASTQKLTAPTLLHTYTHLKSIETAVAKMHLMLHTCTNLKHIHYLLSLSLFLSFSKKFLMPHTEFSSQLRLCLSSKREI